MHPFAYRRMADFSRALMAPNDDSGHEVDDEFDDELGDPDEDLEDEEDLDEEPDEEPDEEVDELPASRQSRGEGRQAKLAREAKELRENQTRLEREIQELRTRPTSTVPQETQEQFNTRLAAMDPVERVAYLQQLNVQNTTQQIQNLQFQIADTNDQTSFNGMMARQPTLAKHVDEVEKRLKDYRSKGVNIPRADVLKHILGEKAIESAGRSRSRASKQADARREQQRARPGAGRSDGGREGRNVDSSKTARDRRLENMKI